MFILIGTSIYGCSPDVLFEQNHRIPDGRWDHTNIQKFELDISDTVSSCNIFLTLRNTKDYPFSNLWLFTSVIAPDGNQITDTIERFLTNDAGKWHGVELGELIVNQIPVKLNVRFPQAGRYSFLFEQGMRRTELPEIKEIGIRVERVTD